jgi:hypothetical protein
MDNQMKEEIIMLNALLKDVRKKNKDLLNDNEIFKMKNDILNRSNRDLIAKNEQLLLLMTNKSRQMFGVADF